MENYFQKIIDMSVILLEIMGTLIIMVSAIKNFYKYFFNLMFKKELIDKKIKIEFGKTLELALEFKIGAEILKTLIIRNIEEIYILGSIVALRVILSLIIDWEIKKAEAEEMIEKKETN